MTGPWQRLRAELVAQLSELEGIGDVVMAAIIRDALDEMDETGSKLIGATIH